MPQDLGVVGMNRSCIIFPAISGVQEYTKPINLRGLPAELRGLSVNLGGFLANLKGFQPGFLTQTRRIDVELSKI